MSQSGYPMVFAMLVWWFTTGALLYLDGLPKRTFRWSMLGASTLFAIALYGLAASKNDTTVSGAYAAFTCGLLAWVWQEAGFYLGYITGPRTQDCTHGCAGWRHFGHAVQAILYHELVIVASLAAIAALTWGGTNHIGLWTFVVLWLMQLSAKLNVFLGVRNLSEEFVPEHLGFIKSFLTKKRMNAWFPVSVVVATGIAILLGQEATASHASPFRVTGYTFLATMMSLAIIEHWFLVLPLPFAALWRWGLRSRTDRAPDRVAA